MTLERELESIGQRFGDSLDRRSLAGFAAGLSLALLVSVAAVRQGPLERSASLAASTPARVPAQHTPSPGGPRVDEAEPSALAAYAPPMRIDFGRQRASLQAREVAQWIATTHDNEGRYFAIVDKKAARVYVFDPDGTLQGTSPVLLGLAIGDDSAPGVGAKPVAQVRPEERTTPAGRFVAEPGRNAGGEDVIWVDYDNAVSMHRVRATVAAERRLQRLASPTVADNRISYGCINVPRAFYDRVVDPTLGRYGGIVYVLPEVHESDVVFGPRVASASTAGAGVVHAASLARLEPAAMSDTRASR